VTRYVHYWWYVLEHLLQVFLLALPAVEAEEGRGIYIIPIGIQDVV
jgi:hypothetical protein